MKENQPSCISVREHEREDIFLLPSHIDNNTARSIYQKNQKARVDTLHSVHTSQRQTGPQENSCGPLTAAGQSTARNASQEAPEVLSVIVDTDPAIGYPGRDVDDGLALLALLADPGVKVIGITVTFGNVSLERGLSKAREILSVAQRNDIPVLAGAASSKELGRETEASLFLREEAKRHAGALVVLGIGPTTNLATAAQDPTFLSSLRQLVLLGGVLSTPSCLTQRQGFEFNFRQDIQAARSLVGVAPRLRLFPMEVCRALVLGPLDIAGLFRIGGVASWAARHSVCWLLLSPLLWGTPGFHPWDVLPAFALQESSPFTYQVGRYGVGPSGELSLVEEGEELSLAIGADPEKFWRCFWDRFRYYQS